MELFIAAFITGLVGSLHCAGMCGPLAIAFNLRGAGNSAFHSFIYNLSRITAYALLGIIFGLIGYGFSLAGWQQILSIATGAIILLFVFGKRFIQLKNKNTFFQRIINRVKAGIQKQLGKQSVSSSATLGFLNGLLPCSLVYIALAGAVATGNPFQGSAYMFLFGLGNFPLMFLFAASGNYLSLNKRIQLRKVLPVFSVLIACLLIIRGLNLGVPYLSPHFETAQQTVECCEPGHQ